MNKEIPNTNEVVFMLTMINRLKNNPSVSKKAMQIPISENDFLLKSKVVIENNFNNLIMVSNYGEQHLELTAATIEAIETIMLDAAVKYDLLLASKALRILTYTNDTHTYSTELVYEFLLKNQSIEGHIGHYEAVFAKTNTEHLAIHQQFQITKEIVLSILEYTSNYRYCKDFSNVYLA